MAIIGTFPSGSFFTAGITASETISQSGNGPRQRTVVKHFSSATVTVPVIGTSWPGDSTQKVNSYTQRTMPGDSDTGPFYEVTVNASGQSNSGGTTPGGQNETVYELTNGVAAEPIATHKNFAALVAAAGTAWIDGLNIYGGASITAVSIGAVFSNAGRTSVPPELKTQAEQDAWLDEHSARGDFLHFASSSSAGLAGVDSYLRPQMTYRISYVQNTKPSSIATVGTIVTPYQAPTLPSGATWLYAGLNYRRVGQGLYEVVEEYRASGPEGWNTEIYD